LALICQRILRACTHGLTLCILSSGWAGGQSRSSQIPTAEISLRGCITGGKRYSFMQASTGAVYSLSGDSGRFSQLRDKLVEITGNEYAPKGGELPRLQVKDLHVIQNECPIQPRAPRRSRAASGQAPAGARSAATPPYVDPGTETQRPPNISNPNITGDTGAPSPGSGNRATPPQ